MLVVTFNFRIKIPFDYLLIKKIIEFDDGSDWTLSKGLTHANRTMFFYVKWVGVKVSMLHYCCLKEKNNTKVLTLRYL